MENIKKCPVCNSRSFKKIITTRDFFLTQKTFYLTKCENCGFVFTNPRPKADALAPYYNSEKYLSHYAKGFGLMHWIYQFFRNINIRNKFKLIQSYMSNGQLLDIGCGTGELLAYFKKQGWNVRGIEPNPHARLFATEAYKLQVDDESALSDLDSESFDVISLWHVLEHVPGLNQRMRDIYRLLKADGLVVIALPNLASWDAQYYGKYWAALDVPRHLYHFTPDTFQKLALHHGLKLVKQFPMKLDAYYVSLLSEKYQNRCCKFLSAWFHGYLSNLKAKRSLQYSSMIYVLKK